MSLQAALDLFLESYPTRGDFTGSAVAELIRNDIPEEIRKILGENDRYLVKGSAGQGNWALIPWISIFDRLITESAQTGYYLVYLPRADFSGVFLSLNQGVTSIKRQYGSSSPNALRARANDLIARLERPGPDFIEGQINLNPNDRSSLGFLYEDGAIYSKFYPKNSIPSDASLAGDIFKFIEIYDSLSKREDQLFGHVDAEEDEHDLGHEDLRVLREHKRIERNKNLSARAKKIHGHKCSACGFDFGARYGALGFGFIEAHHLTPLSTLKGTKVTLDPKKDFTVLCANCHRMIHRSEFVSQVEEFRAKYVVEEIK